MSCPEPAVWQDPHEQEPYAYPFRTCGHCGSIHPDDAIKFMVLGCRVEGTGKNYKRYIQVPNPMAGRDVRVGSRSGPEGFAEIRGKAPEFTHAKIYLWHFTPEHIRQFNEQLEVFGNR